MAEFDLSLDVEIGKAFTPASPVDMQGMFAGRLNQLRRVMDAINQHGQHVVIHGERGVGKTSLANIVQAITSGNTFLTPKINCDSNDLFVDIWRKVFRNLERLASKGSTSNDALDAVKQARESLGDFFGPGDVSEVLDELSHTVGLAIILDECDRLQNQESKNGLADLIKTLSDHNVKSTIILVGVADNVDEIIEEHQSLERALRQVQMPRMTVDELEDIINLRAQKLRMTFDKRAKDIIAILSRGLPHYVHLLGLHAARSANYRGSRNITDADVWTGIKNSIDDVSASIRSSYVGAVSSVQKDAIFRHVLAACALAQSNELGWFSVANVRDPLNRITGKSYPISGFTRHIGAFCERDHGHVLESTGKKHRFRYRFTNPLMQPYAILRAVSDGIIADSPENLFGLLSPPGAESLFGASLFDIED